MQHIKDSVNKHLVDLTVKTYKEHFDKFRVGIRPISDEFQAWVDDFASRIPPQGRIFELGSGTGRDALYFAAKGLRVTCTDVAPQALQELANKGFETAQYDFRHVPKPEWIGAYDGYFAQAVLVHASPEILPQAIANSARILKPGGVACFSFKLGNGWSMETKKMNAPRYFNYQNSTHVRSLLSRPPFTILSTLFLDAPVPGEHPWMYITAQKQ